MGADFHIETTLSGTSEIKFTQKAKENRYQITMICLCVADLQIAKKRVASRVRLGGGGVSSDIMERRFYKSYANIPKMAEICDEIYFYDNSVFVADIKDFALKLIATIKIKS